jgi:hypothetical protein
VEKTNWCDSGYDGNLKVEWCKNTNEFFPIDDLPLY